MHPPAHICKALYDKNPNLRLAWKGSYNGDPEQLNQGCFAVIRLSEHRAVGTPENPYTLNEFWYSTLKQTGPDIYMNVRTDKGPIFNRYGGTTPDWDMLQRTPVVVALLNKQAGLSTYDVFNGWVVKGSSIAPTRERRREHALALQEQGRQLDSDSEACAREASKEMFFDANKTGHSAPIMSRKHVKAEYGKFWEAAAEKKANSKMADMLVKKARLEDALK